MVLVRADLVLSIVPAAGVDGTARLEGVRVGAGSVVLIWWLYQTYTLHAMPCI